MTFAALQEQLGLRLESSKVSTEVLVIDSSEKPTEIAGTESLVQIASLKPPALPERKSSRVATQATVAAQIGRAHV